ncbi:MAG: BadF/BadG/BcrA/BcrD ATPase family protein [bacterium]|nr:BadF/BadG/BcrA/BcrD ATPase family protein [bacterium]
MSAEYILAGEGGGSKTVLYLLVQTGDIVAETVIDGVAAVAGGVLPVGDTLANGVSNICRQAGIRKTDISHAYFSLGGPNQREVESALKADLPQAELAVGREADGELVMACVPCFGCQAAVMAGTGTVAVGEFDGRRYFAGGWGFELDDRGSGGWIGREALAAFLLSVDRRGPETALSGLFQALQQGINMGKFTGRMELKKRVYALERKVIASYAPGVYECFKQGDGTAMEIITRAAADIAVLSAAVVPRETGLNRAGILCLGGIFKLGPEFRELCSMYLREINPQCELVFRDDFDLARGACLMALRMAGSDKNTIPDSILRQG